MRRDLCHPLVPTAAAALLGALYLAAALSLGAVWASPVAGVFLLVAAIAVLAGARARDEVRSGHGPDWRTAVALGGSSLVGGMGMAAIFPEGGSDHFAGTAFWPMLLSASGRWRWSTPRGARRCGRPGSTSQCWWRRSPSPTRSGRPRCAPASCSGRPCSSSSRARGWHRQLDRKVNPLFYDEQGLTPEPYRRWLHDNAVRWVALPDAPLDFSAPAERARPLLGARRAAPSARLPAA